MMSTSALEIAERIGVRPESLETPVKESAFLSLASFVDPWRLVFFELLAPTDISDVDAENVGRSEQEKRVASLRKWKSRYGAEATYRVIIQSVVKCGHVDKAEAICRQFLQDQNQASPQERLALPNSEQAAQSTPSPSPVHTIGEPSCGLEVQIDQLDQQYIEIETLVLETIKVHEVPLDKVLNWIRFPPASLRTQFAEILRQQARVISSSTSIDELFSFLSSYWNLFHPALLQHLVNKLGDEDLKARMDRYMKDLYYFRIRTTLGDFLDKWVGEIPPGYKEFVLEVGEEWRERTVEDFEQFRICLSRLHSFGGGHMSFLKMAKSSSILVVFALPAVLFPLNLRQEVAHNFLRDESIVRVMVDGQCVFDLDKLVDCERELWKLCADKHSNIKKISHLLNQPAVDPNIFDESGWSLLTWACKLGRTDLVALLLDNGANVDLPSSDDDELVESPLITASGKGHVSVCELLIERGATIEYQNKVGATALFAASQQGHKDVVELLLDRGASVDKPNMNNATSLMVGCQKGHKDICQLLIQRGAVVNHQQKIGWSPLHFASFYGHPSVVELLIKSEVQLDILSKAGWTALAWAAYKGHKQIVHILLNTGANPDIQNKNSMTALMLATQRGHKDIVKALVERKANPNITDETAGRSALFFAAEEGHVKITKILVSGGADVDLKDKNDLSPLDTAKLHNQKDVYKFLQKHSGSEAKKDITEEQKQRAMSFTKRLRKTFDNLEWIFLRGQVLKQVEQASREFPSPGSTKQEKLGKTSKKKVVTSEPQSVGRPLVD